MASQSSVSSKLPYFVLAIVAIILDQISKAAVLQHFEFAERRNVIPDFFDLTLVYNPGAAFSFLADAGGWQKFFFLGLAAVISVYLAVLIVRDAFGGLGKLGASMIIGGAIGNVIDRLLHGHVIDFLLFYWQNWFYPAFNVADSFIVVGALLLILDGMKQKHDERQPV